MKKGVRRLIACIAFSLALCGCSPKAPVEDEAPLHQAKQQESAIQLITLKSFDASHTTITDTQLQKMLGLEYTVQFSIPKTVIRDQIDTLSCQLQFSKTTSEVLNIEGSGIV